MTNEMDTRRPWAASPIAFALSAAAVLFLLLSLALPWVTVNVDDAAAEAAGMQGAIDVAIEQEYGSETPAGISLDDGPLLVIITVAFVALLALHYRRGRRGRGLPIAALVVAAIAALVGFGNIADVGSTSDDLAKVLPVSIDVAIGLYLTALGGALAIAGAAVTIAKAEAKAENEIPAATTGAPAPGA